MSEMYLIVPIETITQGEQITRMAQLNNIEPVTCYQQQINTLKRCLTHLKFLRQDSDKIHFIKSIGDAEIEMCEQLISQILLSK